jgi:hypothetical protein
MLQSLFRHLSEVMATNVPGITRQRFLFANPTWREVSYGGEPGVETCKLSPQELLSIFRLAGLSPQTNMG